MSWCGFLAALFPLWSLGPSCKAVFALGPRGGTWERNNITQMSPGVCVPAGSLGMMVWGVEDSFSDLDLSMIPGAAI